MGCACAQWHDAERYFLESCISDESVRGFYDSAINAGRLADNNQTWFSFKRCVTDLVLLQMQRLAIDAVSDRAQVSTIVSHLCHTHTERFRRVLSQQGLVNSSTAATGLQADQQSPAGVPADLQELFPWLALPSVSA